MIRSGAAPPGMRPAGTVRAGQRHRWAVVALGEDVAAAWADAEAVPHTGNQYGYADRVVVAASGLSRVPAGVSASVAAALLHDGPTALALFDPTGVMADDVALVVGLRAG